MDLVAALRQDLLGLGGARCRGAAGVVRRAVRDVGQQVRVDLPSGEVLTGEAVGIDPGGRLRVRTGAGETAVGAGDVVHVRTV